MTPALQQHRCWRSVDRLLDASRRRSLSVTSPAHAIPPSLLHRYGAAAALCAAHAGVYALYVTADEPPTFLRQHALSLERLGFTAPPPPAATQPTLASLLSPLLTHAEYALVSGRAFELVTNTLAVAGAATAMSRGPLGGRGGAPLLVYYTAALAAGTAGVDASLAAVEGWLRLRHTPEEFDELVAAGGTRLLVAAAAEESPDIALIARIPTYGAAPAALGMAAFALLDQARTRPMFATALFPVLASVVYAGLIPPPEVPFPLTLANGLFGTTTAGMNAAGVGAGALCFVAALAGRRVSLLRGRGR